ncbi:MAG: leucine--tRNA ligase [bacterium]|nr:leucine--tRNA ligase [bacterium]
MEHYNFSEIEKKWQKQWLETRLYEPSFSNAKQPFYNLMMFPYPSAEGLHVGNMYAFVGADIYGRAKRMQGHNVFEPIGLDGFGIHSENYALKIGAHPMDQSKVSQENFYRQLSMIGNGFAWEERLETYDPAYYRWTQWVFTQLWKRGLAYRKRQSVNWCPSCKTVLADEQVVGGKCERCGTIVERRDLEQWFLRITEYAPRLLANLDVIDWSERVKIAQRNWIGKSEGARIRFSVVGGQLSVTHLEVFTTRPDTLFGATFMVVSPELAKSWMDAGRSGSDESSGSKRWQASEEVRAYVTDAIARRATADPEAPTQDKTGIDSGIRAVNPATHEEIPVWVSDYVLAGYGTGAIMAVPAHDGRDFEFAKKYQLPVRMVVCPHYPAPSCPVLDHAYEDAGHLVDSGRFDGMDSETAKWAIAEFVHGTRETQYRLRDWLISRQRYWGVPIPMIHCEACEQAGRGEWKEMPGWYAVPDADLPVVLPHIKEFRPKGTGESPLATMKEFYEATCPSCGGAARRETDVSDTFLDSAWYYIGYLGRINDKRRTTPTLRETEVGAPTGSVGADNPFLNLLIQKWLPVNLYTGGAEHSVLHLLYVRFLSLALHDMKLLEFGPSSAPKGEPFPKFRAHGLLIKEGAKMSKSKGNVVNPDEYIRKYGADALRMYLMFLAPFEQGGDFRDEAVMGVVRFLERVWRLCTTNDKQQTTNDKRIERLVHKTVKKVTDDIETLGYNTAISALMILLNEMERSTDKLTTLNLQTFLKLLAPFAPHITEELWSRMNQQPTTDNQQQEFKSIHTESWPAYDPALLVEETATIVVQVNGKARGTFTAPRGADQAAIEALARAEANVVRHLTGPPKRIVFVPDQLINFVL